MGWAEERASEIVEQMRSERPSLTIGRQEEIIAAALQKVADECADVALEEMAKFDALRKTVPDDRLARPLLDKADGAVAACASIRARFPKEGL